MRFERKALIKWTLIILFCGAHSFLLGFQTNANVVAMLLGMATVIVGFSLIESHPYYKSGRQSRPTLAKALDLGVRIRIFLVIYIACIYGLNVTNISNFETLAFPIEGELIIGAIAIDLANTITEFTFAASTIKSRRSIELVTNYGELPHFMASYISTILTSIMHTLVLLLICALAYVALRMRNKFQYRST